jgi:transcriptional regulator with PAS, ATPase and Fis domain
MTQPTALIGESVAAHHLRSEIATVARTDAKILITGESGVGKEITARLIHAESARRDRPFVAINCAGVPETLLETELFGHVRGSFTGAYRDKAGLMELADGGTLLLDEVGEMSLRMQALLLRFLERGELQRVGSTTMERRVDVRIIAATNAALIDAVAKRSFREDLYYRLNVIHLVVPPLRERVSDIMPLLQHFLTQFERSYSRGPVVMAPDAVSALLGYRWPGNIRELRNIAERLVVRADGEVTEEDLPRELRRQRAVSDPVRTEGATVAVHTSGERARALVHRLLREGESFWTAVAAPFVDRDIARSDVMAVIAAGLERTSGSYRVLVERFNMPPSDYKRFMNFLHKHRCHVPFQAYRNGAAVRQREDEAGTPAGSTFARDRGAARAG